MRNLRDLTYNEICEEIKTLGERPYRAGQVYRWVFKRDVREIDSMTDLSKDLRQRLKERFYIGLPEVLEKRRSRDGTVKLLLGLEDGLTVECVLMHEDRRTTLCVSTQVGCAFGCTFCMTGRGGFLRNLTLSEMAGQVSRAGDLLEEKERITNVVLMGMGEPLANFKEVVRFIKILTDPDGMGFSKRKVTLSTAGIIPGIERLGRTVDIRLAVSLNATTEGVRSKLMPINRKYPLGELLSVLRRYPLKRGGRITFEYILIKGINDSLRDARRLAGLLRGIPSKINLIPFNPFPGSSFERPEEDRVVAFQDILREEGYTVVVRKSKGGDISAACGNLYARPLKALDRKVL